VAEDVATRPSDAVPAARWAVAHERLVEALRELIRIPSINPPDPPGPELDAARAIAAMLGASGVPATVYEPYPGRGSVVARLRGDGTGGAPLLLLSHVDVVPAPGTWSHDPFGADLSDGYIWGRGAVDMKDLVAMEVELIRLLAEEAAAAGLDPATDPVPGLRRDILFAATADEEAGGLQGIAWLAAEHPEHLQAAGAINESGGFSVQLGPHRLYPIQVAEKGYAVYRITVRGTWGHGSMPRPDNAAVLAARAIGRLAAPGAPRITAPMARFLEAIAARLPAEVVRTLRAVAEGDGGSATSLVEPQTALALQALFRDTITVGIVRAGVKYNVIPGLAMIEIDCRVLPDADEATMRAEVMSRLGPDLAEACDVELVIYGGPVESPADSDLYRILAETIVAHDPDGIPVPAMMPFATDAKHLAPLGVPCYGFSPLRMQPKDRYFAWFHGEDERVPVEALRWGLPVLYDAVRRFCG
jgi:acetylornithine deacetylase/succinyl-diaminopimelate desuccinylase-like protein